jgi:ABC-type transport system involved in multi-copper enzyme maturation permease subunit
MNATAVTGQGTNDWRISAAGRKASSVLLKGNSLNIVLALAGVVIKELYRRKDFYVLFVLTALMTLLLGSVRFFNDDKIVRYLKEICLLLIWVSGLVIAIATTARQIPAERENRTIFPLLAKPVTRAHVIVGKFLGCWFACGLALVMFYVFFGVVTGSREHAWPVMHWVQTMMMQWLMLGIVTAFVLFGSIVFAAPSSNATISFILVIGILLLGGHLRSLALQRPEPAKTIMEMVYFAIPHLEWFDIREFLQYNQPLVPWIYCGEAAVYALGYITFLLFAAWVVFRRKPLNL